MSRTAATGEGKLRKVSSALEREYGVPRPGRRRNPLDVLVQTILSQNTNDVNRDRAYNSLRETFPTWDDVMNASPSRVARAIRVGGLANQKGQRIVTLLREVHADRGRLDLGYLKRLPDEDVRGMLSRFKGVGPKTVACVMLFGLGRDSFPIDTHIYRVLSRLDVIPAKMNVERAHEYVATVVPAEKSYPLHLNLIRHGREVCHPRRPECYRCVLIHLCRDDNKCLSNS
jgi:endonuclease-3